MPLSEHVYCVVLAFKMTEWVEQWICIKFSIKLEHFSAETSLMIQKAAAKGNWWWAASPRQGTCSCIMSCAEIFCETSNHPSESAPLHRRFGALWLLAFHKTEITFEREEIADYQWDFRTIQQGRWWWIQQRILQSVLNSGRDNGRTQWGHKVPTLKGTGASLSCVQCFLYLFQWMSLFFIVRGWILSGQTLVYHVWQLKYINE